MSDLLTPQDVRDERFDERWLRGGYDTVQVDDFMQRAEHTIDSLTRRIPVFDAGRAQSDIALVWLDIETSGLDPMRDEVLEVGVVVTTADPFEELKSWHWVVRPDDWPHTKARMVNRVRRMHEANGLIGEIDEGNGSPITAVLEKLHSHLRALGSERTLHLAGNSVHFDKRFLEWRNSYVFDALSHRVVDVSSIDVLFKALKPNAVPESRIPHTHRVMDCLETSRLVYAAYLEEMFGKDAK